MAIRTAHATLSKTRFQHGLQCLKRLWLTTYRRELAGSPSAATRLRLRGGHAVGEIARGLWPGGVLVTEAAARHERAVERTQQLVRDGSVPAVFEAAMEADAVRIRTDALVRVAAGFDLVEVKASAGIKREHVTDVAIQLYVAAASGLSIRRAGILHLDPSAVWLGSAPERLRLFKFEDLTGRAREFARLIPDILARMRGILAGAEAPEIAVGNHCFRPHRCPFIDHCWLPLADDDLVRLPETNARLRMMFEQAGIREISSIPAATFKLTPVQERARVAIATGTVQVASRRLRRELSRIRLPALALEIGCYEPALPVYPGTRPHEPLPFQWSAHLLGADDEVRHQEFLWTRPSDPRAAFLESLAPLMAEAQSILVYSDYAPKRIRTAVGASETLVAALADRCVDLREVVRDSVYHPGFAADFSFAPVVASLDPHAEPGGSQALGEHDTAAGYAGLLEGGFASAESSRIFRTLGEGCARRSFALVRLYRALRRLRGELPAVSPAVDDALE